MHWNVRKVKVRLKVDVPSDISMFDDSKFITGVLDDSKFSIGYTNLLENDDMYTLVNIKNEDNYEEIGFGPDFVPICYINEDTNVLFDLIKHFVKTGDKLDIGIWE